MQISTLTPGRYHRPPQEPTIEGVDWLYVNADGSQAVTRHIV
jgi:hypothetical protein